MTIRQVFQSVVVEKEDRIQCKTVKMDVTGPKSIIFKRFLVLRILFLIFDLGNITEATSKDQILMCVTVLLTDFRYSKVRCNEVSL